MIICSSQKKFKSQWVSNQIGFCFQILILYSSRTIRGKSQILSRRTHVCSKLLKRFLLLIGIARRPGRIIQQFFGLQFLHHEININWLWQPNLLTLLLQIASSRNSNSRDFLLNPNLASHTNFSISNNLNSQSLNLAYKPPRLQM